MKKKDEISLELFISIFIVILALVSGGAYSHRTYYDGQLRPFLPTDVQEDMEKFWQIRRDGAELISILSFAILIAIADDYYPRRKKKLKKNISPTKDWRFYVKYISLGIIATSIITLMRYYG